MSLDPDEESSQLEKRSRSINLKPGKHATFLISLAILLIVAVLGFKIGFACGQQDTLNPTRVHGLLGQSFYTFHEKKSS